MPIADDDAPPNRRHRARVALEHSDLQRREDELTEKRKNGKKLVIAGLGNLRHDGEQFVGKKKTLIYSRSSVDVEIAPDVADDPAVGRLWSKFAAAKKA